MVSSIFGHGSKEPFHQTNQFDLPEGVPRKPTGVNATGLGGVNYNTKKQRYNYALDKKGNRQFKKGQYQAGQAFSNYLKPIMNPNKAISDSQKVYTNAMMPQFEADYAKRQAQDTAGLGNRYFSTFGQSYLAEKGREQAQARAQLKGDIYDRANAHLDQMIQRPKNLLGIATGAQEARYYPMQEFSKALGISGNTANDYLQSRLSYQHPETIANPQYGRRPFWEDLLLGAASSAKSTTNNFGTMTGA